jgi:tRNA(fMet)-specific endonuclease VapC
MQYLLDTNICIYIIKQKPEAVFEKFKTLALGSTGISTITFSELYYGAEKSSNPEKNKSALEQFLIPLKILNYDFRASLEYGRIRVALERKGTPIGSLDTLIAAHAKASDLTLVTNNEREFARVDGLKIENWTVL